MAKPPDPMEIIRSFATKRGSGNQALPIEHLNKNEFDQLFLSGAFTNGPWRQFDGNRYGDDGVKYPSPVAMDPNICPKAYGQLEDRVVYTEMFILDEVFSNATEMLISKEQWESYANGSADSITIFAADTPIDPGDFIRIKILKS